MQIVLVLTQYHGMSKMPTMPNKSGRICNTF